MVNRKEDQLKSCLDYLDNFRKYSDYLLIDAGFYMGQTPMIITSDNFDLIESGEPKTDRAEVKYEKDIILLYYPSDNIFNYRQEAKLIDTYGETSFHEPNELNKEFEQLEPDQDFFEEIKKIISDSST